MAIILREGWDTTEMLMISRAVREEIHGRVIWGSRAGAVIPAMKSNLRCALRETEEVLGVDLLHCGTQLAS